jgi:uncharacterized repeat protein (TIGR01451 family)
MHRAKWFIVTAICLIQWSFAQSPPAPDELTEFSAFRWGAMAEWASATIEDSTERVKVGSASLRFTTNGGFDTWIFTPPGRNASWNLSNSGGMAFWMYAENPNIGFQNNSPWVILYTTATDYIRIEPAYDVLNEARGQWYEFRVPFTNYGIWRVTRVGNPNLSQIRWIEIHADTWDSGFRYWIDGLRFDLPPFPPTKQMAIAGNQQVWLQWEPTEYLNFQQYEIYRATQPFDSVVGMTPIAVISNRSQTQYTDATVANGVRYYYAVAVRLSSGALSTRVDSIGPRTPYSETDLQVVSIARTPRFPRYAPVYERRTVTEPSGFGPYVYSIATGLERGQDANTPRKPAIGSTVTYTATVRNRGTNPFSGSCRIRWLVDGVVVQEQTVSLSLAPRQTRTFSLNRVWDDIDHQIRFVLEVNDSRAANNTLAVYAKSVGFLSYVDLSYIENFREETPNYPNAVTNDFIDWLNNHMARFNAMFEQAGTPKRVHFEVLETLSDSAPDPQIDTIYFAVFPFRYRAHEGSLRRLSGYYNPTDDIDYGTLHEMGHQLGLVDLYRLDVDPPANQVNNRMYRTVACLMRNVAPFLSLHSALAMTHWYDKAHGYYGQYLYSMPSTTRLRLIGQDGQPLSNAQVTLFQRCERPGVGEVITNQVKAQGLTDANGIYTLPNVPIDPNLAPCAYNGDCLRDNPFGYVDVVGTNGLLLIKVEHQGFVDYTWLDITEVSNAYWQGQTATATFERQLRLGGRIETCLPRDMTERNASRWRAETVDGAAQIFDDTTRYRVGSASLRLETNSGFDTWVRYPGSHLARWDLRNVHTIRFHAYAANSNIGFQNQSPWIRLGSPEGFIELRPTYDILNQAIGQWRLFEVPLNGNSIWQRTTQGSVALDNIQYIEIHADTWGYGFTLWIDGLGFDPPLRCQGDVDGNGCVDDADLLQVLFAFGQTGTGLPQDVNGDGVVDDADLLTVLFNFGNGC